MSTRFNQTDEELHHIIGLMSNAEKVDLVSGRGLWRTTENERLGIPSTVMTDGTHGVRYDRKQMDESASLGVALTKFLEQTNASRAKGDDPDGEVVPVTCFPSPSCAACSWDTDLLYAMGKALAETCNAIGVDLLLAPGGNIRRTPLAGRGYEYFSEDPVVTGELAAAVINGLQDHGCGAGLKHFVCNNSEYKRTTMSSDVGERALREIYLAGFERAIAKSNPWVVMTAYNKVNGVFSSQSHRLLTDILRNDWCYAGMVMSDWFAIKDRPASLMAGNDLDMPESLPRKRRLLIALERAEITRERLDDACLRVLQFIRRTQNPAGPAVRARNHHDLARRIAEESIVMVRNNQNALPVCTDARAVLVVGPAARDPIIQGTGSATVRASEIDNPYEELAKLLGRNRVDYCAGVTPNFNEDRELADAAIAAAEQSDFVIVFANTPTNEDGESTDRKSLHLASGFDPLIRRLANTSAKIVVVVTCPDAVEMPWLKAVDAVLVNFFPGEGSGHAIARLLSGESTPCGKLTTSFPARIEDIPSYHTYPGEGTSHHYAEDIYVGYRYFDRLSREPAIPFGHGLSYTEFEYGALYSDRDRIGIGQTVTVQFSVRNKGTRFGKEICQLYIRPNNPGLQRPVRELKAFRKIALEAGAEMQVEFELTARDFSYFDPAINDWVLRAESFSVETAASSRDIRQSLCVDCVSELLRFPRVDENSIFSEVVLDAETRELIVQFLASRLEIQMQDASTILELFEHSFMGFADTISWFVGSNISHGDVLELIDQINRLKGGGAAADLDGIGYG